MSEVFFNGPGGRIEGNYTEVIKNNIQSALVLHPHPSYGGTMNNKVVFNTYKALYESGFNVFRINFRGVGRSEGEFKKGIGELSDAAAALDWLQMRNPSSKKIVIAGFSFGAWIALQLIMRRPEVTDFIAIAPPVNKYDFSFLYPCPIPGIIIQGNQDSVVVEEDVEKFVYKISRQKNTKIEYSIIEGGDHFFRDKIHELNVALKEYINCYILDSTHN